MKELNDKLVTLQTLAEANGRSEAYKKTILLILEEKEKHFDTGTRDLLADLASKVANIGLDDAEEVHREIVN